MKDPGRFLKRYLLKTFHECLLQGPATGTGSEPLGRDSYFVVITGSRARSGCGHLPILSEMQHNQWEGEEGIHIRDCHVQFPSIEKR